MANPLPPPIKGNPQGKAILRGPLPPEPLKPEKPKIIQVPPAVAANPKPKPPQPIKAGAQVKEITGKECTRCGSKFIAHPMPQLAVCSGCGHHMSLDNRGRQRPTTRADLMPATRFGTPFRW